MDPKHHYPPLDATSSRTAQLPPSTASSRWAASPPPGPGPASPRAASAISPREGTPAEDLLQRLDSRPASVSGCSAGAGSAGRMHDDEEDEEEEDGEGFDYERVKAREGTVAVQSVNPHLAPLASTLHSLPSSSKHAPPRSRPSSTTTPAPSPSRPAAPTASTLARVAISTSDINEAERARKLALLDRTRREAAERTARREQLQRRELRQEERAASIEAGELTATPRPLSPKLQVGPESAIASPLSSPEGLNGYTTTSTAELLSAPSSPTDSTASVPHVESQLRDALARSTELESRCARLESQLIAAHEKRDELLHLVEQLRAEVEREREAKREAQRVRDECLGEVVAREEREEVERRCVAELVERVAELEAALEGLQEEVRRAEDEREAALGEADAARVECAGLAEEVERLAGGNKRAAEKLRVFFRKEKEWEAREEASEAKVRAVEADRAADKRRIVEQQELIARSTTALHWAARDEDSPPEFAHLRPDTPDERIEEVARKLLDRLDRLTEDREAPTSTTSPTGTNTTSEGSLASSSTRGGSSTPDLAAVLAERDRLRDELDAARARLDEHKDKVLKYVEQLRSNHANEIALLRREQELEIEALKGRFAQQHKEQSLLTGSSISSTLTGVYSAAELMHLSHSPLVGHPLAEEGARPLGMSVKQPSGELVDAQMALTDKQLSQVQPRLHYLERVAATWDAEKRALEEKQRGFEQEKVALEQEKRAAEGERDAWRERHDAAVGEVEELEQTVCHLMDELGKQVEVLGEELANEVGSGSTSRSTTPD
ncbi:hypothetical protein Rhopal_003525-T1 [Rhodotorula paludigena]|uniref:TATA element modulatory factor 1 TATA binding domain-containing protein n=1 Tax=Rhodotorula paludigena TaxID=86838 RepID=A0AAV5GMQ4_9BASI|nr:hypothetical protein Rhopal_003525-T1 [Rhodotorula paludigena]